MIRRPFTPREYQTPMIAHVLDHPRSAVWAGMGMGKTLGALTAVDILQLTDPSPVLVLAPLRVAETTWPDEARKWEHLRDTKVVPVTGAWGRRNAALREDASVYTINYENLPWLIDHLGDRWPFRTVIADESTKLKSFRVRQGGQRARALGKIAHTKIDRFIELTGTPSPNGLVDLWGQMWFIDGGQRLGRSFEAFKRRWFQAIQIGEDRFAVRLEPLPHAQEEIHAKLKDVCLSLNAADYFDIEEPIVNNIYVDLPRKAMRTYRDMEQEMFLQLECGSQIEALNAASKTIKCLQLANGAIYTDEQGSWSEVHDAKLQALESIINETSGAPVLVAYHFKSDRERLMKAFPKALDVGTTDGLRRAKRGQGTVWIGHPASMGHGVDGLQEHCNALVFFGHWWDLEHRLQMIERIGPTRQLQAGYNRPVWIHNIIARHTVDDTVIRRTETKRSVQDLLLEAMKARRAA